MTPFSDRILDHSLIVILFSTKFLLDIGMLKEKICWKFCGNIFCSFKITAQNMKPDGKFCNCLRQSWKKIVGTLAPICYFAHRGQNTEPTSLCHHSMESLSLPLHPNLPHPPSINVGEIGETADDMTSINIGPGGRGISFTKIGLGVPTFFSRIVWAKC